MRPMIATVALAMAACAPAEQETQSETNDEVDFSEAQQFEFEEAKAAAQESFTGEDGFDEFLAGVYKEDFPGGGYVVDGDTFLPDEEAVREFYYRDLARMAEAGEKFTVELLPTGGRDIWKRQDQRNLTFCISTSFGQDYERVVAAMLEAERPWENAANIEFTYVSTEDENCNPRNPNVKFDVRPVSRQPYLARAFFPSYERSERTLAIDSRALGYPNAGAGLTLTGILRHELGHVLGASHEHYRPEAGACRDFPPGEAIGSYDAYSVMHYPHCNGLAGWALKLTEKDRNGIACLYGPANGFTFDTSLIADFSKCVSG